MRKPSHIYFAGAAALCVSFDQITKLLISDRFFLGETIPVVPNLFKLVYARNTGVAFSLFAGGGEVTRLMLLVVPTLVVALLCGYYLRTARERVAHRFSIALIVGGAVSNLMDRFRLGYVVDFLDFHWRGRAHYPAFNVADIAVCTGVGLLFLLSFRKEQSEGLKHV